MGSKSAAGNINDLTASLPKKANRMLVRVDRDPVAEAIDFWTRDDGRNGYFWEFRNSAQRLFDLNPFQFQLVSVLNVLVIAAATSLIVGTGWCLAVRRGLQNGLDRRQTETLMRFRYSDLKHLAVDVDRHEDHFSIRL